MARLGVQWVSHKDPCIHLQQHNCYWLGKRSFAVWCAVAWTLWSHRNRVIFAEEREDFNEVIELYRYKAWSWISTRWKKASFSYYEWYANPSYCLKMIHWMLLFKRNWVGWDYRHEGDKNCTVFFNCSEGKRCYQPSWSCSGEGVTRELMDIRAQKELVNMKQVICISCFAEDIKRGCANAL